MHSFHTAPRVPVRYHGYKAAILRRWSRSPMVRCGSEYRHRLLMPTRLESLCDLCSNKNELCRPVFGWLFILRVNHSTGSVLLLEK